MQVISIISCLLLFCCAAMAQEASLFAEALRHRYTDRAALQHTTEEGIFSRHFGVHTVRQAVKQTPGPLNPDAFLNTPQWKGYREQMATAFGTGNDVGKVLEARTAQAKLETKTHNVSSTKSLLLKGNLTEQLMDDFYINSGWEKLSNKVGHGAAGIDGLYVKRNSRGNISECLVVDAKSGNAKLSETKHGKQLSQTWQDNNFRKKLFSLEKAYRAAPSDALMAQIRDYQTLLDPKGAVKMREPRIFSARIESVGRHTYIVRRNLSSTGTPIAGSRAYKIEMNSMAPDSVKRRTRLLSVLEKE